MRHQSARRNRPPRRIVRPDVALVLNVDIEHTEGLGSLEGVADEEAALFGTATIAVTGAAESMLLERAPKATRHVTFGTSPSADVRLLGRTDHRSRPPTRLARVTPSMIEADLASIPPSSPLRKSRNRSSILP